jgi:acyl carrier protein
MTRTEIDQKITQLLREIKGGTSMDDPQIEDFVVDSLDAMKFIVKLEETFNLYIDEQYLGDRRMFDDKDYVIQVIEKCLQQPGS